MNTFKGHGLVLTTADEAKATRHCGDCQLCCKLLPIANVGENHQDTIDAMVLAGMAAYAEFTGMMPDFDKPAGCKCPHQKYGKGCTVYRNRPLGCRIWNCAWLGGADTQDQMRPDRSHVVIDIMPDFVTLTDKETGARNNVEVVQIWLDPKFPDAHRDPHLRAYLARRAEEGKYALIRTGPGKGFLLWAPSLSRTGRWEELHTSVKADRQHSASEIVAALGGVP